MHQERPSNLTQTPRVQPGRQRGSRWARGPESCWPLWTLLVKCRDPGFIWVAMPGFRAAGACWSNPDASSLSSWPGLGTNYSGFPLPVVTTGTLRCAFGVLDTAVIVTVAILIMLTAAPDLACGRLRWRLALRPGKDHVASDGCTLMREPQRCQALIPDTCA